MLLQCAVKNSTLFSCFFIRLAYDSSVTRKKGKPHLQSPAPPIAPWLRFNRSHIHIPMIRPFLILDKLIHIHFSDRRWLELEAGFIRPDRQACPSCGARGCLTPWGNYARYLVEIRDRQPVTHAVSLQRFFCNSCGHTHTVHPSCLVPYRSYSLRFILTVLRAYFLRLKTVGLLCEGFGIAVSTLYRWKELFLSRKALWLGVLADSEQTAAGFLEGLSGTCLRTFLSRFCSSFMEQMPGRVPELPSGGPGDTSVIT